MTTFLTVISYILIAALGYLFGYYRKKHKIESILVNKQIFFENQSRKQAAVIEEIKNNLEYFTVGQLYELSEYFEENDFDEDEVLLGIFNPEKTDILL